ncbi:PREDICTED: uncharacterized protein LOC109356906 isoform X2 [Lupinus angustifolius]|uniref:uncharacterized protein LOC109356906 isoform X2 n=1 Tax=Lupinus angustifolius TaxID=3871 RepID=UPI00092F1906|nr:PREDICTED: uncharacterized protein LOC109356906 isoform X2 [Lupinus angustifolius]
MAKASYDVEFDKENKKTGGNASELEAEFGFPSEFPYEFDSFGMEHINSPVESVAGSTETESSDEEEFFAGLTRRLSQASLHETLPSQLAVPNNSCHKPKVQEKVRVKLGSPQSTLSGMGDWSGQGPGSSDVSPNGSSRVPSPNTTPFSNDAWDAIYAAAEQVAKLKTSSDRSKFDFQNRGVRSGFAQHVVANNRATPLFSYHNLNQGHELKQEQMLKHQCGSIWGRESKPAFSTYQQQLQAKNKGHEFVNGSVKCTYPLTEPAWHNLQVNPQNQHVQPHSGYGSKSVSNAGSGVKRGCAGTGVFLPRQYVAPHEPRKKTIPAKAIHAVNLNIDDLSSITQQRFAHAYGANYNALLARRNAILMQQVLNLRREEATSYEMRLPQEWNY